MLAGQSHHSNTSSDYESSPHPCSRAQPSSLNVLWAHINDCHQPDYRSCRKNQLNRPPICNFEGFRRLEFWTKRWALVADPLYQPQFDATDTFVYTISSLCKLAVARVMAVDILWTKNGLEGSIHRPKFCSYRMKNIPSTLKLRVHHVGASHLIE